MAETIENKTVQSASRAGAAIGSMIFTIFGCGWLIVWSTKVYGNTPFLWAFIVLVGLCILIPSIRLYRQNQVAHASMADLPESKRSSRVFNTVNIGQGVAIFMALNVTNNVGHPEWFIPAFIFIVGAHFIPLVAVFKVKRHYAIGSALMVLAVTYPFMTAGGASSPIGCLGAGLMLWVSAIAGLMSK